MKLNEQDGAAAIAAGRDEYTWIMRVITDVDSRALVAFFDKVVD